MSRAISLIALRSLAVVITRVFRRRQRSPVRSVSLPSLLPNKGSVALGLLKSEPPMARRTEPAPPDVRRSRLAVTLQPRGDPGVCFLSAGSSGRGGTTPVAPYWCRWTGPKGSQGRLPLQTPVSTKEQEGGAANDWVQLEEGAPRVQLSRGGSSSAPPPITGNSQQPADQLPSR